MRNDIIIILFRSIYLFGNQISVDQMGNSDNTVQYNDKQFLINGRLKIVLHMETSDQDDFITFIFLLGHTLGDLKSWNCCS